MRFKSIIIFLLFAGSVFGQLEFQHAQTQTQFKFAAKTSKAIFDTLSLPFFDDFSNYTGNPDTARWEIGGGAFVNVGMGISPPSLGVVTFDGISENGAPYDFRPNFPKGTADNLTSLPIDLSGLNISDDVSISFFWQQGGFGEAPDEKQGDSLILEFKVPLTDSTFGWKVVWGIEAVDTLPADTVQFAQIFLDTSIYFINDFQFRFRNRGTLSGSYDNWHLDYIILDAFRFPGDQFYLDRTLLLDNGRIFKDFTSIPAQHIKEDSLFHYLLDLNRVLVKTMANNISLFNIQTIFKEDSTNSILQTYTLPNSKVTSPYLVPQSNVFELNQNAIENFNFSKEQRYYFSQSSILIGHQDDITRNIDRRLNDTAVYYGNLAEYYAYDDGVPELGVGIRAPFGKVAVEYALYQKDTLTGIDIMFLPAEQSINGTQIGIRVWSKLEKDIDPVLYGQNIIGSYGTGRNGMLRINFDSAVIVEDTIYIGWVQFDKTFLNVGYDMNNQFNNKIYTKVNASVGWQNESDFIYPGAMIIRPVFDTVNAPIAQSSNSQQKSVVNEEEYEVLLAPNPVQDYVEILGECDQFFIYDLNGRISMSGNSLKDGDKIDLKELPNGSYIIKFVNDGKLKNKRLQIFK